MSHVPRATCDVPRAQCKVPQRATAHAARPVARGTWHVARRTSLRYSADQPPSKARTIPVTLAASSLASHVMAAASCSGSAIGGMLVWNSGPRRAAANADFMGASIPVLTGPGATGVDPDPLRRIHERRVPGEPDDGMLRGGVGRAGGGPSKRRLRGHVHDRASLLAQHDRQHRAREAEDCRQVDRDDTLPRGIVKLASPAGIHP